MPIYKFNCQECGEDCEILVRNRSTKPACPACGSKRLEKKLSVFSARGSKGGGNVCTTCNSSSCSTCRR